LDLSKEETLRRLKEFRPDIMGFMMTTYMFNDTLEWIRFLKKALDIPVVIGGYNLRVYPKESVSHKEIDFGVYHHAYHTVPGLLNALEKGTPPDNVPGLIYKKNGDIIVNPDLPVNFEDFPFPARDLLPNELYAEFPTERKNFTVMVTSLGCPYKCVFCEAGRTEYNPRTPETVVKEIEECVNKYGIREIDIFDYDFTVVKSRVEQICDLIIKRRIDVTWACRSRIGVGPDLLKKMREAGCRRIYYGIESGNQETLDRMNKGITLDQVRASVKNTKKAGIRSLGFFLIGAPGDTVESVRRTVSFAKSLDLDYVQFSKCLAKPLTPLWKEMIDTTGKDYWKDWILGKEKDRPLPRPWTELTNEQIDELAKWAYVSYHTRPVFIIRNILKLRSFDEMKRKFFAFFDMIFRQESSSRADESFRAYHEK
jgi:radical SAM superfamily enzyme YgiQ (UPF0313 family)